MIKNATIKNAEIEFHNGSILNSWLTLDYGGGSVQGFGGWAFDTPIKDAGGKFIKREGHACGAEYIRRTMEVADTQKWSELKGKNIRVRTDSDNEWGGVVVAIGHITKDDWFCPKVDLAHLV